MLEGNNAFETKAVDGGLRRRIESSIRFILTAGRVGLIRRWYMSKGLKEVIEPCRYLGVEQLDRGNSYMQSRTFGVFREHSLS